MMNMISTFARCSLLAHVFVAVSFIIGSGSAFTSQLPTAMFAPKSIASSKATLRYRQIDGEDEEMKWIDDDIPYLDLNQQGTRAPSPLRIARLKREEAVRSRFVTGDELRNLRDEMKSVKEVAKFCQVAGQVKRVAELQETIKSSERRDPNFVYAEAISAMRKAKDIVDPEKRKFVIDQHRSEANLARECIPCFNLEGLWVGNE